MTHVACHKVAKSHMAVTCHAVVSWGMTQGRCMVTNLKYLFSDRQTNKQTEDNFLPVKIGPQFSKIYNIRVQNQQLTRHILETSI